MNLLHPPRRLRIAAKWACLLACLSPACTVLPADRLIEGRYVFSLEMLSDACATSGIDSEDVDGQEVDVIRLPQTDSLRLQAVFDDDASMLFDIDVASVPDTDDRLEVGDTRTDRIRWMDGDNCNVEITTRTEVRVINEREFDFNDFLGISPVGDNPCNGGSGCQFHVRGRFHKK